MHTLQMNDELRNIFLIGGGWRPEGFPLTYAPFVRAATRDGNRRIALLIVLEPGDDLDAWATQFRSPFECLSITGNQLTPVILTRDRPLDINAVAAIDPTGIFVCGGLTPLYQELLCTDTAFRDFLLSNRLPYGGFSAGSAIAARRALVGGWKLPQTSGGLPVVDQEVSENIDDITVRPGLGLVPVSVDVHCGQWGTLTRLINAAVRGLVNTGWGIDEDTMLEFNGRSIIVYGLGQAYRVAPENSHSATVNIFRPGDRIDLNIDRP